MNTMKGSRALPGVGRPPGAAFRRALVCQAAAGPAGACRKALRSETTRLGHVQPVPSTTIRCPSLLPSLGPTGAFQQAADQLHWLREAAAAFRGLDQKLLTELVRAKRVLLQKGQAVPNTSNLLLIKQGYLASRPVGKQASSHEDQRLSAGAKDVLCPLACLHASVASTWPLQLPPHTPIEVSSACPLTPSQMLSPTWPAPPGSLALAPSST